MNGTVSLDNIAWYVDNLEKKQLSSLLVNFKNTIRSAMPSTSIFQGYVNNKLHIYIQNITGNYSGHLYWSPKYNRYQMVFCKIYSSYYTEINGVTYLIPVYIYGRADRTVTNGSKAFNPAWLDVYYDTIYTANDSKYFINVSQNDAIFYNKFGDAVMPLIFLPFGVSYDAEEAYNQYSNTSGSLYYTDTDNYQNYKFSCDNPIDYTNTYDVTTTSTDIIYGFDKYIDNDNTSASKLLDYNICTSIKYLYNHINNSTINNINKYNIYTLNNDYTIIAGDIAYSTNNIAYTNLNACIDLEDINSNPLYALTSIDNKQVILNPTTYINNIDMIEPGLYDTMMTVSAILSKTIPANKCGLALGSDIINATEYNYVSDCINKLGAVKLASKLSTGNSEFDSAVIQYDFNNSNNLDIVCFDIIDQTIFVRAANNTNFKFSLDYILPKLTSSAVDVGVPYTIVSQGEPTTTFYTQHRIYRYTASSYVVPPYFHTGQLTYKRLVDTSNVSSFESMISSSDISSIPNYTRLVDFEYDLSSTSFISDVIISNSFLDDNRFKIYGVAVNLTKSNANQSSYSSTSFESFKTQVDAGIIKVEPFPVPMTTDFNEQNVATATTIAHINNAFGLENTHNKIIDSTNLFDPASYKRTINTQVSDSSTLSAYDKSSYTIYNQNSWRYNFIDLNNKMSTPSYIYMIYDTLTDTYDLIKVSDLTNFSYHLYKLGATTNRYYWYGTADFYEQAPQDVIVASTGTVKINENYTVDSNIVYFTKFTIASYIGVVSEFDYISLTYNFVNTDTDFYGYDILYLHLSDFTTIGNDLVYEFSSALGNNIKVIGPITYTLQLNAPYHIYSYTDSFNIKFNTNFSDISVISYCSISGRFNPIQSTVDSTKLLYSDIYNSSYTLLPQVVYNKNISLSIFNINDDVWKFVPDNNKCIIFNHYINNNQESISLTDLTSYDTSDIAIFDTRYNLNYKSFVGSTKTLPALIKGNVDKYVKVQMKLDLHDVSTDLIETFEYDNLYNISLKDETKGVLIVDGKISDIIDTTNFNNVLKEYKINLTITASHNVNNTITVPIYSELIYELYSTYDNYINNIDSTTYDIQEDTILLEIKNRGEYITTTTDYTPKLLDYIEYFDVYPEYSWQQEIQHIKTLEFNLSTSDSTMVKVSELYFDILFFTDDVKVAIPIDYETHLDPENETNYVIWSSTKKDILSYFNQLIRYKCANCTTTHIKLKVKTVPNYFGFNIESINFGCYSHNIKLEWFMPYIFYKESADTIMIINKQTSIDKTPQLVSESIRESYWSSVDQNTAQYFDELTGASVSTVDLVDTIDKPTKSKVTCVIFNSSFNNKKLVFDLESNSSPKTIHNTHQEFSVQPLDFRIITLYENIDVADYTTSFDSGIANYKMIQYDEKFDTSSVIGNVQLSIPSMDDYIRTMLNFFDKLTKVVTIDYESNIFTVNSSNESKAYQSTSKVSAAANIIKTSANILNVTTDDNLSNIDYKFYINEIYDVIVDRQNLSDVYTYMSNFGDTIYIKVPFLVDETVSKFSYVADKIYENNKLWSVNPADSTSTFTLNNLFNVDDNYLYLVGKRTNVDQWTFSMKGIITITNDTLLDQILNSTTLNLDKFTEFGINIRLPRIHPELLLSIFFWDYSHESSISMANIFVGKDRVVSTNFGQLTKNLISLSANNVTSNDNLLLVGTSKRRDVQTIEMESVNKIEDIGIPTVKTTDVSMAGEQEFYVCGSWIPKDHVNKFYMIFDSFVQNYDDQETDPINVNGDNWESWLFDDVYNILSTSNILTDMFSSNGLFVINLLLYRLLGVKKYHYISIKFDNSYDNIIAAKLIPTSDIKSVNTNGGYEIYYKGDNKITLNSDSLNILSLSLNNLKQNTVSITVDDTTYVSNNVPYSLYGALQKKLLEKPLLVKCRDYSKTPIEIVSDTNYKMIFEMPIQIFKAIQSYITIDKIKVADNFINDTDYCIIFGDNNDQHNILSGETKLLGKTYDKYDKNTINILLRGFNIPNQSGEFYTTIAIYYTFNGEQYTITRDIRYRVVLPSVLDNEYLIATVTRLDGAQALTTSANGSVIGIGDGVTDESNEILVKVMNGTAGCNLSYPDLNWFKI